MLFKYPMFFDGYKLRQLLLPVLGATISLTTWAAGEVLAAKRETKSLTPIEKFNSDSFARSVGWAPNYDYYSLTGKIAFNANDTVYCDSKALFDNVIEPLRESYWDDQSIRVYPRLLGDAQDLKLTLGGEKTKVTVGSQVGIMLDTLDSLTRILIKYDDRIATQHHVCVGIYRTGAPNARSYESGYIFFEAELVNLFNQGVRPAEDVQTDFMVTTLHEMSHQFQYWHGNPFQADITTRRTELAADCITGAYAAAILGFPGYDLIDRLARAAENAGDLEVREAFHHGRPMERRIMLKAGASVAANVRSLRTADVLRECNALLDTFDLLTLEPIAPHSSEGRP